MTSALPVPPLLRYAAVGLLLVAAVVGFFLFYTSDKVLRLDGTVLKVRSVASDDNATLAVLDIRVKNPSKVLFQVKEVTIVAVMGDGSSVEGQTAAEMDIDRVLQYHPALGRRYTAVLKPRAKLHSSAESDFTVAASFPISETRFSSRSNLIVRIQDVDGGSVEIAASARQR